MRDLQQPQFLGYRADSMVPQTSSPQSGLVQQTGKSVVQIAELPENNLIARNVRVGKWLDVDWKAN